MKRLVFFLSLVSLLGLQVGCESKRGEPQEQQEVGPPSKAAPHAVPERGID